MLVKWVRCHVVDAAAFERGQRGWAALSGLPGFLGQCGGWSRREPGVAHVLACWRGAGEHAAFLRGAHDGIAAGQAGSYDRIEVRLLDRVLDVGAGVPPDLPAGAVARLAHCRVRPDRVAHFERAQAEVWNPGMRAAPGMRGGVFARRDPAEFLVFSVWRTVADHERYRVERLPELRRRAGAADDLVEVTGDLVDLVPAWTVPSR